MDRYTIYVGENLSKKKYLETWKLDNHTFEKKHKISKKSSLNWFLWSEKSTIVLWDNKKDKLVGYITPYLLKHDFCGQYIKSDITCKKALTKDVFVGNSTDIDADIYLFSSVVVPEYRDVKMGTIDINTQFFNKTAFQVLNEALVDWVCEKKKNKISINYVFGENISKDSEKYFRSLSLYPCCCFKDDLKYVKLFSPSIFKKCSNVNRLYELYFDSNSRNRFDKNILKNHEYLSIVDNSLYYKDINLLNLIEKYKAPLEVTYTPMIKEKILYLKNLFKNKIKKYKYPSKYYYAYATKANYSSEVVLTALNDIDMLETSSAYDINIVYKLVEEGIIQPGYKVLCNGFKNEKYLETLKNLLRSGIKVIPIIENEQELTLISKVREYNICLGIRYNCDFESRIIKDTFDKDEECNNRFGFDADDVFEIARKIKEYPNLTLSVFHFHFGGTISNIDNYIRGYSNIVNIYCNLKKENPTLQCFDFGGGFPVKYALNYTFDYDKLVDKIISVTKKICSTNKVECPDLIGEHGRFTVADSGFYLYKIDFTKEHNGKYWYILNGSLMNMVPDIWGIKQDFSILPVNLYSNFCIPVCLGGETCDPDDRYFINDENVKLFMPVIEEGQTLYIAIFSIGAYQEIISGMGGLHHCLIPEGNELIIYKDKYDKYEYVQTEKVTDNKKMFKLLDYDDKNYMNNFITNTD